MDRICALVGKCSHKEAVPPTSATSRFSSKQKHSCIAFSIERSYSRRIQKQTPCRMRLFSVCILLSSKGQSSFAFKGIIPSPLNHEGKYGDVPLGVMHTLLRASNPLCTKEASLTVHSRPSTRAAIETGKSLKRQF